MEKLTEKSYWDTFHKNAKAQKGSFFSYAKNLLRRKLGLPVTNYSQHLFYEEILRKQLKDFAPGSTIFEIGSAPGGNLLGMWKRFGFEPYGVEYSEEGYRENVKNFSVFNLPKERIFHADAFDMDFQSKHREEFDIVFSRGFIEHFDDPASVVKMHMQYLRSGGALFIVIPNLRGIHWIMTNFFHRASLEHHNLKLMKIEEFGKAFDHSSLTKKACGYYGTFNFGLYNPNGRMRLKVHRATMYIQNVLDLVFRLVFGSRGFETRYTSPYLYYVGIKK